MNLRMYQRTAVRAVIDAIDRWPILVAPTGSGKTVMAVELVRRLVAAGVVSSVLWLAHRKELVEQAAKHLEAHGEMVGIVMPGHAGMPLARYQVASRDTLIRREKPAADLVILDECHHATSDSYRELLDCYRSSCVVGLTATPFRLDGQGLGDIFGAIIVAAYTDQLIEAGFLATPRVYATRIPDLRGVKVVAGDYSLGSLAKRMNTGEAAADIVGTWLKHAAGKRTVCFGVDVEHSMAIAAAFNAAGVPFEHLDGNTPGYNRGSMLAKLGRGELLGVSNCMVLTEGWDLPALECAIIARPTASLNLHLQMIGRVMRAAGGKDGAIVLDFAGNHHRHGQVTRRLNYSLDGKIRIESEPLGLRRCMECGLLYETGLDACPGCGAVPQPGEVGNRGEVPIHGTGELSEFDDENFEYRQWFWNALEEERLKAGFKDGWSWFRFKERFGVEPVVVTIDGVRRLVDPQRASMDEKHAVYLDLLERGLNRGFAEGWVRHRYREIFGTWPNVIVGRVRESERIDGLKRFGARLRGEAVSG